MPPSRPARAPVAALRFGLAAGGVRILRRVGSRELGNRQCFVPIRNFDLDSHSLRRSSVRGQRANRRSARHARNPGAMPFRLPTPVDPGSDLAGTLIGNRRIGSGRKRSEASRDLSQAAGERSAYAWWPYRLESTRGACSMRMRAVEPFHSAHASSWSRTSGGRSGFRCGDERSSRSPDARTALAWTSGIPFRQRARDCRRESPRPSRGRRNPLHATPHAVRAYRKVGCRRTTALPTWSAPPNTVRMSGGWDGLFDPELPQRVDRLSDPGSTSTACRPPPVERRGEHSYAPGLHRSQLARQLRHSCRKTPAECGIGCRPSLLPCLSVTALYTATEAYCLARRSILRSERDCRDRDRQLADQSSHPPTSRCPSQFFRSSTSSRSS